MAARSWPSSVTLTWLSLLQVVPFPWCCCSLFSLALLLLVPCVQLWISDCSPLLSALLLSLWLTLAAAFARLSFVRCAAVAAVSPSVAAALADCRQREQKQKRWVERIVEAAAGRPALVACHSSCDLALQRTLLPAVAVPMSAMRRTRASAQVHQQQQLQQQQQHYNHQQNHNAIEHELAPLSASLLVATRGHPYARRQLVQQPHAITHKQQQQQQRTLLRSLSSTDSSLAPASSTASSRHAHDSHHHQHQHEKNARDDEVAVRLPAGGAVDPFLSNRALDYPGLCVEGARYELLSTIHGSLFGSVKLALDHGPPSASPPPASASTSPPRRVCIKMSLLSSLKAGVTAHASVTVSETPLREAELLRQLHSGKDERARFLIGYVAEYCDHWAHYLVTEFADGGDLFALLSGAPYKDMELASKATRLEIEHRARTIFTQLAAAVCYMHSQRIAHRDLSIENVVLTSNGELKLIDLGLACDVRHVHRQHHATQIGKIAYMSPEAYFMHTTIDWLSNDIYALGVILFSLLVGRPPYFKPCPSDQLFTSIISSAWLTKMHDVNISRDAAKLIDMCIKPEARRATWDDIWNCAFLKPTTAAAAAVTSTNTSPRSDAADKN